MKREGTSKGDHVLESMSYVDMDLVNAAEEDRLRPPLDRKRWPRRILSRVAMAMVTMAVVVGLVSTMKEQMQWDTPEWNSGGAFVNYADLICYEGQLYFVTEAPEKDAVGERVGKIGASWIRHPEPDPDGKISATHLPKNAPVHVWEGYSSAQRLCAQRENGEWAYYVWECDWAEEQANREPLDIKVVTPEAAVEDTVYYLGATYTRYLGPEILGGSHVGIKKYGMVEADPSPGQGRHPVGTPVYEWSGHDPWYRIAVRSAEGGNYYYERWTEEELAGLTMKEYLPLDEQVTAISLRKRGGTLVGMITDPQAIRAILSSLREEAGLSHVTYERVMDQMDGRYMDLVLTDGSTVRFMLYDSQFGYSMREFSLPAGFLEEVHDYEIYEIDEGLGSVHYGSPLIAEWARPSVRKVEQWVDGQEVYTMGSVWLDGERLCMGHGGCYGPLRDQGYTVLAEDVAGDLRMEDMEIWYRTAEGQVAYLYFWYPHGFNRFYEDLDAGVDLSPYIQEHRILYDGPVVKLQVRDGVVWTLDEEGVLRKETEIIATEVTCFVLDASGTIYGTTDGLYRLEEQTGQCLRLVDGEITAVTSGGMIVYYATAEDQIQSIWVDGTHHRDICAMDVRELHYINMAWGNGFSTGMIRYEDCLILIDSQGRAWLQRQQREHVLIGENIQTMQYLDEFVVQVQYTDGAQENINLLNYLKIH